jgi:hypothetical protein
VSLLDNGPHTATVTTYKLPLVDDEYGNREPIPDKTFEVVGCSFRPMTSEEVIAYGGRLVDTSYRVTHREWPGGPYTHVKWGDLELVQVGDTLINGRGIRTKHKKAFLRTSTAIVR